MGGGVGRPTPAEDDVGRRVGLRLKDAVDAVRWEEAQRGAAGRASHSVAASQLVEIIPPSLTYLHLAVGTVQVTVLARSREVGRPV